MDLHTKRTGHLDFVDKTLETAKPIDLEQQVGKDGHGDVGGCDGTEGGNGESDGDFFLCRSTFFIIQVVLGYLDFFYH